MSIYTELDYYYIMKNMAHRIDDGSINLFADTTKKENALKQFSDLIEEIKKDAIQSDRERMRKKLLKEFCDKMVDGYCNKCGSCRKINEILGDGE